MWSPSERLAYYIFSLLHQNASEVFNLEQIVVWTLATAIVGLEQVKGRACMSTHTWLQFDRNPGSWYRLGKLYGLLGIQHPARWSHVGNILIK